MTRVYSDDAVLVCPDRYVLHYRNGFTGAFKQVFKDKEELNKEVLYLQALGFEYSGRKGFNQWKSFYVTLDDELVLPKEGID